MKSRILWVRISYWLAALADFYIAIAVLNPERVGLTKFEYPMGMTSAIAFSWGIMLIMADRKPIERRWVLLPTFIVVSLLTAVGFYASQIELIELNVAAFSFGVVLSVIILVSYRRSKNVKRTN